MVNKQSFTTHKIILAFVGMPGAGKSEAATYLKQKGVSFIRFGQFTDDGVKEMGLTLNPDNERMVREKFRKELGMAAYAIMAKPKIKELLKNNSLVVVDGLYSWEEYVLLKQEFLSLTLINIYSEPLIRYERLLNRPIRPVSKDKSRERDILELEKLNKGGPIAIADYCIINNGELRTMYDEIDEILKKLNIIL